MAEEPRCPYIIEDQVAVVPVAGRCRPAHENAVKVLDRETFARYCTTSDYATCPGYQAGMVVTVALMWGERVPMDAAVRMRPLEVTASSAYRPTRRTVEEQRRKSTSSAVARCGANSRERVR